MKIIIAGAGEVGYHIAKLMSQESLNITVVDPKKENLERIENMLDVMTHRGDGSSFKVLEEIGAKDCDIFIAVTQLQNTNLMAALIAKKLGAKKVVARVTNPEFLERKNIIAMKRAGIDTLISPEELAANEIVNLVEESVFKESHQFENGVLNLFGVVIGEESSILGKTVKEVADMYGNAISFMPIFVIRTKKNEYETLVPRGDTVYQKDDHIYFIALDSAREIIYRLLGKSKEALVDVMVLGGGRIGTKTAILLKELNHSIKIIERNKGKAFDLADDLRDILVLHGDGRDTDLMNEEGISEVDAFVAVTGRSETNIMACLLAKAKGVKKTIALVENTDYIHLSQEIGIDSFINKKLMAANEIFKHVRKGKVLDVTNLYDLKDEVLEYKVEDSSRIANVSINDLHFPREPIIGGVVRNGKGYIPTKDFVIKPMDRVVVFSKPGCLKKVEEYFES